MSALEACDAIVRELPEGRANIRNQIERACTSIVANIAEGAGEFSAKEKARFYRMARRSAVEVVAWLDILAQRREAAPARVELALRELDEVVAMLVRLIQRAES